MSGVIKNQQPAGGSFGDPSLAPVINLQVRLDRPGQKPWPADLKDAQVVLRSAGAHGVVQSEYVGTISKAAAAKEVEPTQPEKMTRSESHPQTKPKWYDSKIKRMLVGAGASVMSMPILAQFMSPDTTVVVISVGIMASILSSIVGGKHL